MFLMSSQQLQAGDAEGCGMLLLFWAGEDPPASQKKNKIWTRRVKTKLKIEITKVLTNENK